MPKTQPALLETGQGSIIGALDMPGSITHIHKSVIVEKLPGDRLGIILPVGCDVDGRARFQDSVCQITKTPVNDTALMVTLLMPGIGEKQQDAVEQICTDHLLQYFDRIVLDEPQIV